MADERLLADGATYPRGFAGNTDWKWPLVPVRNLVTLNYGRALKADTRTPGKVPVYGTNGQCGWHDAPLAKAPGLILGRKGQGPLGVEWCDKDFWVIDTAYYASTLTPDIDLKYLYHLVKYVGLNHLKDGTSNPTLSRDTFGAQLFPLPPVPTQRAIAHVLGTLDDLIELNRETNEILEEMARALFKSWFVDFDPVRAKLEDRPPAGMDAATAALFPDHFQDSELGQIPKGWEVRPLSQNIELLSGGTPKTSEPNYWNGDIPWYSVRDAPSDSDVWVVDTEKRVTASGIANSPAKILPEKTTIISARGTVGKLALVGRPMAMNQSCYGVRGSAGYGQLFTYYCLKKSVEELQQNAHGSVFDTITRETFTSLRVASPPPGIAESFDRIVEPLLETILANVRESRDLAALRDTLLPKLLSGEISAPVAEELIAVST